MLSLPLCCGAIDENLKPLVTGNAALSPALKPQRTVNKHRPLDWSSNREAWMK